VRQNKADKSADGRLTGVFGDLLIRRFKVRQPETYRVIESVVTQRKTTVDKAALCELAQTAMDLDFDGVEGDFLHAGRAADGTVLVLENAKRRSRPLLVHEPPFENISHEGELALAHLDSGDHAAMNTLLERLVPRLVSGGHLIIDDYKKEECRRAVDGYFQGKSGFRFERRSRLHVIRS
jgi:hypothetical protein